MDDGAWHRVAVTKNCRQVRLYVDGAEVAAGLIDYWVGADDMGIRLEKPMIGSGMAPSEISTSMMPLWIARTSF